MHPLIFYFLVWCDFRLGSATPVSYSEIPLSKKGSFETEEGLLREGSKPEVYSEEQLKLLGCSNTSWTLFVDGYGKDGKRIYDQINGKTCHQCRLVSGTL